VLAAQRLYPGRRPDVEPARRYRDVLHYPTRVGSLLFVFTLAGYTIGALQLRVFAALPVIEQAKNVAHGLVISLLLAVLYRLAVATDTGRHLGTFPAWGAHGRLLLLRPGDALPAADFAPATRARVAGGGAGIVHDSRRELKSVGFVDAPRLGGTLVGVTLHT